MTAKDFRKIALSFPGTVESRHMSHPDFRVKNKIFATILPDPAWGCVMLSPEEQTRYLRMAPGVFVPAKGAWGRRGCTQVSLKKARASSVRSALAAAWRDKAPAALTKDRDGWGSD